MLLLFFFSAFLTVPTIAQDDCDKCYSLTSLFFDGIKHEDELVEQMQIIKQVVCPEMGSGKNESVDQCLDMVDQHWRRMVKTVLDDEVTTRGLCEALGYCPQTMHSMMPKDACSDCLDYLYGSSQFLVNEYCLFYTVDILNSESFCGAPDISPDRPDKYECRKFVEEFIPLVVPVLAQELLINVDFWCTNYFQAC